MAETLIPNCIQRFPSKPLRWRPDSTTTRRPPIPITAIFGHSNPKKGPIELPNPRFRSHFGRIRAAATPPPPSPSVEGTEEAKESEESTSIDLRRFFELNSGKWNGSFYQFDANGNLLQNVSTTLSASSYGEDELISLIQTLYIRQPPWKTSIAGYDAEPEWTEYKIKEINTFTADKYQQIGFFPKEKAFSLRYQTAGMLDTVLRAGVLGEDDTGEESPRLNISL